MANKSERVLYYMELKKVAREKRESHDTKTGGIDCGWCGKDMEHNYTGSVSPIGKRDCSKYHGVEFKSGCGDFTSPVGERLTSCRYIAYSVTGIDIPHVFTEKAFRMLLIDCNLLREHKGKPSIQSYLPTEKFRGLASCERFILAVESAPTWTEWIAKRGE